MAIRLPPVRPADYTDAQRLAAEAFTSDRGEAPYGPFDFLLHSPEVMTRARRVGDYLRFKPSIGKRLAELAILVTAREWSQDYEWTMHVPMAEAAGLAPSIITAIRAGRRPEAMNDDEAEVYDFVDELLRTRRVSDASFARIEARHGRIGIVDLTGVVGYYSLLAMQLNVARYEIPGMDRLPRFPD
jgi:4-carboxymuconolactone decarboxylase